jgi:hypothetical protein
MKKKRKITDFEMLSPKQQIEELQEIIKKRHTESDKIRQQIEKIKEKPLT